MSLTRSAARTRIRTLINEPTARYFTDAEINTWIDDAVRDISIKTLCCTSYVASGLTTTSGIMTYAFPTTLGGAPGSAIVTLGVNTIIDTNDTTLEYVTPDLIGRASITTEKKWSTWNEKIFITPAPTATETLYPVIWRVATCCAAGTLDLPAYAHHLVPYYGVAMAKFKKREYDAYQSMWSSYTELINALVNNNTFVYGPVNKKETIASQSPMS